MAEHLQGSGWLLDGETRLVQVRYVLRIGQATTVKITVSKGVWELEGGAQLVLEIEDGRRVRVSAQMNRVSGLPNFTAIGTVY